MIISLGLDHRRWWALYQLHNSCWKANSNSPTHFQVETSTSFCHWGAESCSLQISSYDISSWNEIHSGWKNDACSCSNDFRDENTRVWAIIKFIMNTGYFSFNGIKWADRYIETITNMMRRNQVNNSLVMLLLLWTYWEILCGITLHWMFFRPISMHLYFKVLVLEFSSSLSCSLNLQFLVIY